MASRWEKLRESFFSDRVREKAILAASVAVEGVAADIGAGTGFITEGLARRGVRVIAVDESAKMLEELRRRIPVSVSVDCRVGSAESIPIDDEAVDYVFANMLLHHVEEPSRAIREMARVLRPGGVVVVTDLDRHEFEFLRTEQHTTVGRVSRESRSRAGCGGRGSRISRWNLSGRIAAPNLRMAMRSPRWACSSRPEGSPAIDSQNN